ncbi:hypothetical protein Alg130_09055 [Pyrenophora tritici-repentis]|nr:hypothetical protein Alg130_09055 [Pyrenophora tritici-repentis]KAI0606803.1 hypothetical protein TUN205_08961 [Pyrenophora tritici-repentis]
MLGSFGLSVPMDVSVTLLLYGCCPGNHIQYLCNTDRFAITLCKGSTLPILKYDNNH